MKELNGKVSGFLKRLKNFAGAVGSKVVNGLVKGIGKVNDVYKAVKPHAKPIVDALLNFVPGGTAIGAVAELGFDKASSTVDELQRINKLDKNTFLPLTPSDPFYKHNKEILNRRPLVGRYSNLQAWVYEMLSKYFALN